MIFAIIIITNFQYSETQNSTLFNKSVMLRNIFQKEVE